MSEEIKKERLTDEQAEAAVGGVSSDQMKTLLICLWCDNREVWNGDYYNQTFKCPHCGMNLLRGLEHWR